MPCGGSAGERRRQDVRSFAIITRARWNDTMAPTDSNLRTAGGRPSASPLAGTLMLAAALLCMNALVSAPGPAHATGQPDTSRAQPRLPEIRIKAGMHVIRAEVAADGQTRMMGLMHRERLELNAGMLFVFERAGPHCFWMRNTPLPLSIAFIDDDGRIVNIADMTPLSDDSHCPTRAVRFALEMEQGWFAAKGIGPGSTLSAPGYFGPGR